MYAFEAQSIRKTYGGVTALANGAIAIRPGTVHALLGENGAGKSTLMKVLSGVYPHGTYDGDIVFENEVLNLKNIRDSEHLGIVIIHQELALSPYLSIAENIFLNNEIKSRGLIDWNKTNLEAQKLLAKVGLSEDPNTPVNKIGVGKQQLVEIAKALSKRVKLLILDEPTRGLDYQAKNVLTRILINFARATGKCVLLATHDVELVAELASRVIFIADGDVVADGTTLDVLLSSPAFAPQVSKVMSPQPWLKISDVISALENPL